MTLMSPKAFVFVLMPFDSQFDDVYTLGIKAACADAGAYCERVDEQIFEESILERIYNQIAKADVVIADMTGRNPNVFYETGYAHALGKRVILLTRSADDIPFDLKHYSHVVYEGRITVLKEELTRRIKWAVAHPAEVLSTAEPPIQLYVQGFPVRDGGEVPLLEVYDPNVGGSLLLFQLDAYNPSTSVLESPSSRVGLVVDLLEFNTSLQRPVRLPDGKFLHRLDSFDDIFPDSWSSVELRIRNVSNDVKDTLKTSGVAAVLRVSTQIGVKESHMTLRLVNRQELDLMRLAARLP